MSTTVNKANAHPTSPKRRFFKKKYILQSVWTSRMQLLKACAVGGIVGLVIAYSTPREYSASTLIVPESTRSSSSQLNTWAGTTHTSAVMDRDAIYPSLYPRVIKSTPFLLRLSAIEVRIQADSLPMPLFRYLKEHQKQPWWRVVTSAPSRWMKQGLSLFRATPQKKEQLTADTIATPPSTGGLLRLTRAEANKARAVAARIGIGVDKEKRTITLSATMQNPLVAATVVDSLSAHLRQYITHYRTSKARRLLQYQETLCQEAQAAYYAAQDNYTQFADANRNLAQFASRARLVTLRNEMNLAYLDYQKMEKQVEAAKERVEKERPVYAVIQPVTVPLTPSKPRKALILATCIVLSGLGSIGWILFGAQAVHIFNRIVRPSQISPNEKR